MKAVMNEKELYMRLKIERFTDQRGRPCVHIWRGKQAAAYARFFFTSEERRADYINGEKEGERLAVEAKKKAHIERKSFVHSLKVGDILKSSWGYDQTNVDFYQVTALRGKGVRIREIGGKRESVPEGECRDSSYCVADPGTFKGEEMFKIPGQGNYIRLTSYSFASLWDGTPQYYSWGA